MLINRAYRYELDPNREQRILLAKHAGASRFAYNWGLARRISLWEQEKKHTDAIEQHRLHRRIKDVRKDYLHKLSTSLAKTKREIVIEDLCVKGLARTRLARSVNDVGWGEFRRMLEYKTKWYGSHLTVAPRYFPSSKTCSACGHVQEKMSLSVREWTCPECGAYHDRDMNAALNLLRLSTGSSPGIHACGDSSAGALQG